MCDSQVCVLAPTLSERVDCSAVLLQITSDVALGGTRAALLEQAGFHVSTIREANAFAYVDALNVAVVLFCQMVRRERAFEIGDTLSKRQAHPFKARLTFSPYLDQSTFDAVLSAPVGPSTLILGASRGKWSFISPLNMR